MAIDKLEKKIPHLYLDMDGVQADFFGAWADKHNVSHWKAIQDKEGEIEELANSTPEQVYKFFRELKPLQSGQKIIAWLKQHNVPYTVLSAPLGVRLLMLVNKLKKTGWTNIIQELVNTLFLLVKNFSTLSQTECKTY